MRAGTTVVVAILLLVILAAAGVQFWLAAGKGWAVPGCRGL